MIEEPPHRAIAYPESPHETRTSALYGHALRLLWSTSGKHAALGDISRRLWPAVLHKQIDFLFNSKGIPVGFVTWAYLTEACAQELMRDPDYVLHLSEWNEGDQLWIMDIVSVPGHVRNVARKLRETRLRHASRVHGRRPRRGERGFRRVCLGIPGSRSIVFTPVASPDSRVALSEGVLEGSLPP